MEVIWRDVMDEVMWRDIMEVVGRDIMDVISLEGGEVGT